MPKNNILGLNLMVALTVVVAVAVADGGSNHDNYTCNDDGGNKVNKRMFIFLVRLTNSTIRIW
jgi:hypothetical protein